MKALCVRQPWAFALVDGGSQLSRFEHQKDHAGDLSPDFFITVVFPNQEEKQAMLKRLRVPKGESYISGNLVMDALKALN